jgi:menaquinone-9 beta-reductase
MKEKTYDAVIVGAGPAGATTAFILSRAGRRVLLLDKRTFPRPKLCAGLLTWKTTHLLERIFQRGVEALASAGIVRDQNDEYILAYGKTTLVQGRMGIPFRFIDRSAYDAWTVSQAKGQGAEYLNEEVVGIDPSAMTVVTAGGRSYRSRVIIGADGASSRVKAAAFGRRTLADLPDMAATVEIAIAPQALRKPPSIHFGYLPWGYAWSFPSGNSRILGICGLNRRTPAGSVSRAFDAFLRDQGVQAGERRGHLLPYGNFLPVPGRGGILLAGDACGLADPLLGEGIYYAHASAALAARAVLSGGHAALDRYTSDYAGTILKEMRYAAMWRNITYGLLARFSGLPLKLAFLLFGNALEETIHGRRSFVWLRRLPPLGP